MQILRIHADPHPPADPKGPVRTRGGARGVGAAAGNSLDQETVVTESADPQLGRLIDRLKTSAAVRQDVVQAARDMVARGEFSTRAAAEKLASTELRHEFFSHHP